MSGPMQDYSTIVHKVMCFKRMMQLHTITVRKGDPCCILWFIIGSRLLQQPVGAIDRLKCHCASTQSMY